MLLHLNRLLLLEAHLCLVLLSRLNNLRHRHHRSSPSVLALVVAVSVQLHQVIHRIHLHLVLIQLLLSQVAFPLDLWACSRQMQASWLIVELSSAQLVAGHNNYIMRVNFTQLFNLYFAVEDGIFDPLRIERLACGTGRAPSHAFSRSVASPLFCLASRYRLYFFLKQTPHVTNLTISFSSSGNSLWLCCWWYRHRKCWCIDDAQKECTQGPGQLSY